MSDQQPTSHANRDVRVDKLLNSGNYTANEMGGFSARPQAKKFVAKGHDAQLEKAQYGRLPVTISLISGSVYVGTIVKRDKFTITLRHDAASTVSPDDSRIASWAGQDEIFYKHAIEGVLIKQEPQA